MARTIKNAEVRKNEILDVARRLFIEVGYDTTTVNSIIDELGISKGAFYHHFESKEEVLQALSRRLADEAYALYSPLTVRTDLTPLQKLNALFGLGMQFKKEHASVVRAFSKVYYRDENLRLRAHIIAQSMNVVGPLFARILDEGMRDGSFDIQDPEETARLVMHMGTYLGDTFGEAQKLAAVDLPGQVTRMRRASAAYERALENMLGLPRHTINISDDDAMELFLKPEGT
jgi:AcrR family transcriptional regulator